MIRALLLTAMTMSQVLLSGCGSGNDTAADFEKKKAADRTRYLEILEAHRDELTAQLARYERVSDLIAGEIPAMDEPVQIQLVDALGNDGNTFVEMKAGIEQLADPDLDVSDARNIYTADAGGYRPHLRPVFFSSSFAETKAAFDHAKYRDYPDALEQLLERLNRAEYLIVLGGAFRTPQVFDEGDPIPVGIGAPMIAKEATYQSADVNLTAWLIDVKQEKLLGAVQIKARNRAREVRRGQYASQVKRELDEELEGYVESAITAAVDWFESGGKLHKSTSGVESAKDRPWFLQPADENPVWEVIPLPRDPSSEQ